MTLTDQSTGIREGEELDAAQIDPRYYEKPYLLVPGKKAEKGYVLLRETLKSTGMAGIARAAQGIGGGVPMLGAHQIADRGAHLLGVVRGGDLTGADRPDRLVGDHHVGDLLGGEPVERGPQLSHDVLDVLAAEGAPDTVIFHCFSSGPDMARTCADAGWLMSLSGTVSFRNAASLRDAARLVPQDLLLVETDAPFLTPHPFRGAPNESYCLPYTVRALAEVVDRPAEDLARQTADNAARTYGIRR
mgnify:CR=1 FL=1